MEHPSKVNINAFIASFNVVRRLWLACLLALFPFALAAQDAETGAIAGRIVDSWQGNPVAGVTVLVRGTTLGTTTDSTGNFTVTKVPPGIYAVVLSRSGYSKATLAEVRVVAGQKTPTDYSLKPEFFELETFEAVADPVLDQGAVILIERQKSLVQMEAIGAAQYSRLGASDAGDIISKAASVTVSESKSPVVRGLNERYVGMTLNGAEIPSPDPYRKSPPLDLFPASMIDKVVVNKTFLPNLPGNFTGGGIDIITKTPEKFFFTFSAGLSYNSQASLNSRFLGYEGGRFDWAAIDDGTRALPGQLSDPKLSLPDVAYSSGRPNQSFYGPRVAGNNLIDSTTRALGAAQFAPTQTGSGLNNNFSLSFGDKTTLFGRPFGFIAGLSYNREFNFYENGIYRRYQPALGGGVEIRKQYSDTLAKVEATWSSMVGLNYELSEEHKLGFNFIYNQYAEDQSRVQVGTSINDPSFTFYRNRLYYTERNLTTYQFKGEHELKDFFDSHFDWTTAFSLTSQDEPDARFFNELFNGSTYQVDHNALPDPKNPTRYFRNLEENSLNTKLDWTLPFEQWSGDKGEFKTGYFFNNVNRDFIDRAYLYKIGVTGTGYDGDPNSFLDDSNLGIINQVTNANGSISYTWDRYAQLNTSTYYGALEVKAGYFMLDFPLSQNVRLVGGARVESTDFTIHSESYLASSFTGNRINDARLQQTDLLPAGGLIWTVITNMNVRLNYSETLARPSFRELAAYRSYDPLLDELLEGNPLLKMSAIKNYDFRWEWFQRPGEIFAVSVFYKELKNAIEKRYITTDGEIVAYDNREQAKVYGIEFEARKNLGFLSSYLEDFTLGGNMAFMDSQVALTPAEINARTTALVGTDTTRPLYDQSPYIYNVDLSYENARSGTSVTLAYNVFGPRIVIAGLVTDDIYEQPAAQLDLMVSQRLGHGWKLKLSAKNLLNPLVQRTVGEKPDNIFSSYRKGQVYGVSLSYDF